MPDAKQSDKSEKPKSQPLTGDARLVVQTLMPISLIWQEFLERHEYVDDNHPIAVTVPQLMELVKDTVDYANGVYRHLGVNQTQFDEIANEISPLLYPPQKTDKKEPPHPDKDGDGQPAGTKK